MFALLLVVLLLLRFLCLLLRLAGLVLLVLLLRAGARAGRPHQCVPLLLFAGLLLLGTPVWVETAALDEVLRDAERVLESAVLLLLRFGHLMRLLRQRPSLSVALDARRARPRELVGELLAVAIDAPLKSVGRQPLLLQQLLVLDTLELDLALALVVEDLLVGLAVDLCLESLQVVLVPVLNLIAGLLYEREIILYVPVGA